MMGETIYRIAIVLLVSKYGHSGLIKSYGNPVRGLRDHVVSTYNLPLTAGMGRYAV